MRDSKGKLMRSRVDLSDQEDEEKQIDKELDEEEQEIMESFEGLMLYLGIPKSKKDMKIRLKHHREEFKNQPSMLRVLGKL